MNRGRYRALWASTCVASWCALLVACSSTQHVHVWNERYIVAARAQDEGRDAEARAHYAQLLKHAPDEEARRLILYRLALMSEDEGRFDEAMAGYRALYSVTRYDEYGARALYRHARYIARADGELAALPMYNELITHYGDWVASEHAVAHLTSYHRQQQGGARAALGALLAHREEVRGKAVEGDYLMQVASLHQELGDEDATLASYGEVLEAEHLKSWWDDALWERAELYTKARAWDSALHTLEVLATAFQETSWFVGDYSSEHADQARYEMGRIYLEELQNPAAAVSQYDRFLKDFKVNRLRDDAAWMRLRALKSAGDTGRYARELARFPQDYPESRYLRRLEQGERP